MDEKMMICPKCEGNGKVWADGRKHYPFAHVPTKDCPECNGTGKVPVPSTPASEVVCQCGHSVIEHFEGGGDVTYCEHKDGFYHCPCPKFVAAKIVTIGE